MLGGNRLAEIEALGFLAAVGFEESDLLGLFDSFGNGFDAQAVSEGDDGFDNGLIFRGRRRGRGRRTGRS